ncbi:MAG TPA: succinate CoA transferase [Syntrophobacteraceae bacterium]|nr:succinate CoA transferase [Syntrophobacteraceae bacterium]
MSNVRSFTRLTPQEAALHISHGNTVAFSGFANAGAPKAIPRALAARARELHDRGEPFKIRVLTGGSGGADIDEALSRAEAVSWRAAFQSSPTLRKQINRQEVEYVDMHLSHVPTTVSAGFFGKVDVAVVEAVEITPDGRVYLSTSIGASPTFLRCAERVLIEINASHSPRLREMSDVIILSPPPHRNPIPIQGPLTKLGWSYAVVDPRRVMGVVENNEPDDVPPFDQPGAASEQIAEHVVRFLFDEMRVGRIPESFLPLQAGVGNIANGVMAALGRNPYVPPFKMFSLVLQDSEIGLMEEGKITGASATSLTLSPEVLDRVYRHMDFFVPKIVLRPQEIANHPAVVRRLGVIAMNAVLEVDIYGNANSSHVYGTDVMNGVGGSGEFIRNSYISIIMCPSVAKGGRISSIVPMCPHIDSNEHSIQIVVTDQGLADLRGLGPMQRAKAIIENCAHPAYRETLYRYIEESRLGHIRHNLRTCFELHRNLARYGAMLPDLELWDEGEQPKPASR